MIDYDGGKRPVGPNERVRVRLRSGKVMRPTSARNRIWEYCLMQDPDYQIVAYEVVAA